MFVSLGAHVRFRVRPRRARRGSEVAHGLAGVAATLHEDCLAASGGAEGKLVES